MRRLSANGSPLLEEAANEFRRYSKRFAAGAQKETAAIFDLYSHLLSDARLRRELFAEVDKGSVAEWAVKKVIEKFAEQFAVLTDGYLKERAGDLRALGQRLLFHLDDTIQGANAWPNRFVLVADELGDDAGGITAGQAGGRGGARWRS